MEKLCYALWRTDDLPADDLRGRLLGEVASTVLRTSAAGLRMQIEDPAGDFLRYGGNPHGDRFCASISVWLQTYDDRSIIEDAIGSAGCRTAGWLVTESRPIECSARDWPDGQRSPGLGLVTLLDKRADVDDAAFFARWHGSHTPLTFDIHPFWLYLRNSIARQILGGELPFRALVEETVGDATDMLDLHRFYGAAPGDDEALKANMARINADLLEFCDMATLETCPAGEWILRSGPGD